jgi:hypothetical protein
MAMMDKAVKHQYSSLKYIRTNLSQDERKKETASIALPPGDKLSHRFIGASSAHSNESQGLLEKSPN